MQTLEGIRARRRLEGTTRRHRGDLQTLAANTTYAPEVLKARKERLRRDFWAGFTKDLEAALRSLKGLKLSAEEALRKRRQEDPLAEKACDTLAEKQLKASKRLERELVKARVREELKLSSDSDADSIVRLYRDALERSKGRAVSVEAAARVEALEDLAPVLLERMGSQGPQEARTRARCALAEFGAVRTEDLKRLRPESARQLEAVRHDFRNLLGWVRSQLASLGKLKSANEIAGKAALFFENDGEEFRLDQFNWSEQEPPRGPDGGEKP